MKYVFTVLLLLFFATACSENPPSNSYQNDFESSVGTEWSKTSTDITPAGNRRFLGQFGNETVTLSLTKESAGTINLEFDLFLINSWDGNNKRFGPDYFIVSLEDGRKLLHTTFSNTGDEIKQHNQSYPESVNSGDNPDGTGSSEKDTLGYSFYGDSVYRIKLRFQHKSGPVKIKFTASGLQGKSDESWGLDNVLVTGVQVPNTRGEPDPSRTPSDEVITEEVKSVAKSVQKAAEALLTKGKNVRGTSSIIGELVTSSDEVICDAWIISFNRELTKLHIKAAKDEEYDELVKKMNNLFDAVVKACDPILNKYPVKADSSGLDKTNQKEPRVEKCKKEFQEYNEAIDNYLQKHRALGYVGEKVIQIELLPDQIKWAKRNLEIAKAKQTDVERIYRNNISKNALEAKKKARNEVINWQNDLNKAKKNAKKADIDNAKKVKVNAEKALEEAIEKKKKAYEAWGECITR